ncbi:phosphatase PAP2 family protein [Phytoactinopolyspora alkaliphila]|uniref:Phosphatase PAP2 family protein n=1 Tax=Phytoactinopolyspora alkaliphila TaxID=1783498 RepID=A0A6N9YHZ5_9ACTN|nr:phosphatase PAP2 family protein [Phytoactinopolyspora alkaliphila]NED94572.1 phosphatase PAP2 family protein [Phytoactinopolyspora alkaliphila]
MGVRVIDKARKASSHAQLRRGAREVVLIAAAALLYSLVRGLTDDRVNIAFENAERVISFQRSLGIFVEPEMQSWVAGNDAVINTINAVYIAGYWPVLLGTFAWLLFRQPARYALFRNALLASGAITLVIFALFPLAPPRFLPEHGFVDTVSENSAAYRDFSASPFVNEYAAMPSLHFGWILLVGIAWATVGRTALAKAAGMAMPVLMFTAIVLTGNHYIVDGIVGGLVVLLGLAVAVALERRRAQRMPTPALEEPRLSQQQEVPAGPHTETVDNVRSQPRMVAQR